MLKYEVRALFYSFFLYILSPSYFSYYERCKDKYIPQWCYKVTKRKTYMNTYCGQAIKKLNAGNKTGD